MIFSMQFKRAFWLTEEDAMVSCPVLPDGTIQDWNWEYITGEKGKPYFETDHNFNCLVRIFNALKENRQEGLYEIKIKEVVA
tara:strand:- start:4053 stop:4298 length:246 start_codon:yes stop_codon:yes gene_type:complete